MKKIIISLFAILCVVSLHAVTITNETFEGGATGWSNNTTTTATNFTTFLGRFGGTGGAQSVYKTYTLGAGLKTVTLQFDLYEIDTWDGESFYIYINDSVYQTNQFWFNHTSYTSYNSNDTPSNAVALNSGTTDLGFLASYSEEFFRYTITLTNTTISSLKLGFGSTLDESVDNESWGIDNLTINAIVIPEPSTFVLAMLTLAIAFFYRKLQTK